MCQLVVELALSGSACRAAVAAVGIGTGMSYNHLVVWAINAAPKEEQPMTASATATMRALGIAYGAAIATAAVLAGLILWRHMRRDGFEMV